jgi:hypothetical protein
MIQNVMNLSFINYNSFIKDKIRTAVDFRINLNDCFAEKSIIYPNTKK